MRILTAYALLTIGIGLTAIISPVQAKVACNETSTCEAALRPGSKCTEGYCTNPFVKGCLNAILGDEKYPKIRTCNSDDKPGTVCAESPLDYEEIRIAPNNWESAMFYAWVIQILLSEVLDVPSTVETNVGGSALNFYDEQNGFGYPKKANPFDTLYKANEVGDCRDTDEPCSHFITEMWQGKRELNESAVEREGNGMVGHVGWFIPKFAAEDDASLTHYLGLIGDANRQKLADTFKRPLRWIDYCTQVSANNCTTDDGIASRAPADEVEAIKYFQKDVYTGHFIHTEKNDCATNPNCTGHMVDYPCTWGAYTTAQLYWNDIPLESDTPDGTNSYSYSAMLELIEAAFITKNPILIVWWYPDPTMEVFDLLKVTLPETSRACLENRPEAKPDRCGAPRDVLIGDEVGSCGYNTHTLEKYFARSFRERSVGTPIAIRSPGHQLVRNTQLSDIDLNEMMIDWVTRGVDKWNYDPREAVCTWVANNYEEGLNLKYFLPPGYPRVVEDEAGYNSGLNYFSIAFGVLGSIVAASVGGATYHFREEKQIRFAQAFFLYLFSLGFFLVGIGSSLYSTVPSPGSCSARWWFIVIGFTFVFVPLLIKIAAINKLMNDAKKMRRTNVSKSRVYKIVAAIVFVVVIYLSVWTGIDRPMPESELVLREETGSQVDVHIQCASKHQAWEFVAFGWEGLLICSAAAVAYLSRNIRQAFNESKVVANVAYTSFFFWVFRLLVYAFPDSVLQPSLKNSFTSLLLTLETLLVIGIYFGLKFYSIYKCEDAQDRGGFSAQSTVFYRAGKNEEMCPLCERPMPKGDEEHKEPRRGTTRSAADTVASLAESGALSMVSTHNLSTTIQQGDYKETVRNPSVGSCDVGVSVTFQDNAAGVVSVKPELEESKTMSKDSVQHGSKTAEDSTNEKSIASDEPLSNVSSEGMNEHPALSKDSIEHGHETTPDSTLEQSTADIASSKDSVEHGSETAEDSTNEKSIASDEPLSNVSCEDMNEHPALSKDSIEHGHETTPDSTLEQSTADIASSKD